MNSPGRKGEGWRLPWVNARLVAMAGCFAASGCMATICGSGQFEEFQQFAFPYRNSSICGQLHLPQLLLQLLLLLPLSGLNFPYKKEKGFRFVWNMLRFLSALFSPSPSSLCPSSAPLAVKFSAWLCLPARWKPQPVPSGQLRQLLLLLIITLASFSQLLFLSFPPPPAPASHPVQVVNAN